MKRLIFAIAVAVAFLTGCGTTTRSITKEDLEKLYVGSPHVREHYEGVLLKVDTVAPPPQQLSTTDTVGVGLVANSSGALKGVGAAINVLSVVSEPVGVKVYVFHLRDKNGEEIISKPIGPISPRPFAIGANYRILIIDQDNILIFNKDRSPKLAELTDPKPPK